MPVSRPLRLPLRATAAAILALGLGAAGIGPAGAAADPSPAPAAPSATAVPSLPPPPSAPAESQTPPVVKAEDDSAISAHSRDLLARAEAAGRKRVTIMALTEPKGTQQVADGLRALGGSVGYRHDDTGYLRASLPTGVVTKAAQLAGVQALDLDETLAKPTPRAAGGKQATSGSGPWTGPNAQTGAINPYLPTHETGAVAFKAANPAYDGRGITIGVLDSGVDLDHPALAKTTTGERKIVDWFTATDPLLEGDGSWRPMLTKVSSPQANYGGARWTLPNRPGADFAINAFRESVTAGSDEYNGDVNRDGDTTDVWGVLYDYASGDIWVDVNQNRDFTDEVAMRPYAEKFQVGHFGTADPNTKIVERVPFVVEYRKDVDLSPAGLTGQTADFVNIGIVADSHGSHVAGIAAGHGLFAGQNGESGGIDGAAPGAKIVSAKACLFAGGCTTVALTEGMIELVANRKVDVVNMSIGGLPALNDGNNVRTRLYNRLIDTYGVQLFVSAGNSGPGLNTIGDPSVASDVVSVGAAAGRDTWKANYGADVTAPMAPQNYSSRGPREDGGFKPDVLAPGSAISTVPQWVKPSGPPLPVSYTLPPGYAMYNGTSMASPEATGAAALLLSAARAQDLAVRPDQLRGSMFDSSRFLGGVPTIAQGNGLIDVVGAWQTLRTLPDASSRYTISAPVCTPLSPLLATPNAGAGLYNRCPAPAGGVTDGARRTDTVTITRTAGPRGAARHTLRWVGNDGTFSTPGSVNLPLGKAVQVRVSSRPRGAGVHSATLQIDSPDTPLVDARMSAAVVVSDARTSAAPYAVSYSGTVERTRTTSYFVGVPQGAKSLQVDLSGIATGSQVRWIANSPYGVPMDSPTSAGTCFTNDRSDPKVCNATSRSYADPLPGVWELQVEAKRSSATLRNPFAVRAAVQGVTVTPAEQTVADAAVGDSVPVQWRVRNDFGDVTVVGRGGPLGSGHQERPTIHQGEQQRFEVTVPEGAANLTVSIDNPSEVSADLDLYLYDEAGDLVGLSGRADSQERISLDKPQAGTYTAEVDAYEVGEAGTQYDYLDVFTSSGLGELRVSGTPVRLAAGQETTMTGSVVVRAQAPEGRTLVGELQVVSVGDGASAGGAVLGRGRVLLGGPAQPTEPTPTAEPTPTPSPTGPTPTVSPTQPTPSPTQPTPSPTMPTPTLPTPTLPTPTGPAPTVPVPTVTPTAPPSPTGTP